MQNEAEKTQGIDKSGPSTPIPNQAGALGLTSVHEDEQHKQISSALASIHPEAGITKDAVPPPTEPTPGLVQFPEPKSKLEFRKLPVDSSGRWSGVFNIFQREKREKKGELPNAA